MLASVELKKRENRDDLDLFLQMNGLTYLVVYIVSRYIFFFTRNKCLCN